ncbi:hypothetical protein C8R43DRAFT_899512, partial [Mycena crocata]
MAEGNVKLFKGDGIGENATDFLNSIRRRFFGAAAANATDTEKIEYFELCLKDGSYASLWFSKLPDTDKKTFKDLTAAFRLQWPAKEMAEKSKGEQQEELLSLVLDPLAVGVRVEEDGILEWGHVRWARKVAELGARVDKDSGLITQVLKNIPDALLLQLGPKRDTWAELVQAMKDIPTANMGSMRREGEHLASLEAGLAAANTTIAALQTPTRGLTAAAAPVTIHPRTPAGQAQYEQQMAAYTQSHGNSRPSEDRPLPLTPGTVAVGSGECHQCGQLGHFFDKCTTAKERYVPEAEMKWRQIVQSIISRIARALREATAVNIVADDVEDTDSDVFGTYPSAEYDQLVIEEFLASQGKGRGPNGAAVISDAHVTKYLQSHVFDLYSVGTRGGEKRSIPFIQRVLLRGDTGEVVENDAVLVPSRGFWSGDVCLGGEWRPGRFEVFPSGGAWAMLFGKPLLTSFSAWHGYGEDVILL